MRVVIDTNVLVSGVFFGGVPGRILDACVQEEFELVLSPPILEEYRRVGAELGRKRPSLAGVFEPVLAMLTANAVLVKATPLRSAVSADADDDKFLAAALLAHARFIVSGDRHLLDVSGWRSISVLTPRAFFDDHLSR